MHDSLNSVSYPAGHLVFKEGDEADKAYRILEGRVEIAINGPHGRIVLGQLHPGDIFGEMALVDDKPRSADALALTDVVLEAMDESDFNTGILQNPENLLPYLATFFERLRTAQNRLRILEKTPPPSAPAPAKSTTAIRLNLKALTPEAAETLPATPLRIEKLPFRIGRMPRTPAPDVFSHNDLLIRDRMPFVISRNHLAIEQEGHRFLVTDRGSTLGTRINDTHLVLAEHRLTAELKRGINTLVLGNADSPYRYTLELIQD
jgi:CRP-like cAMP-binding protein